MHDTEGRLRPVDGILIFGTAYLASTIVTLLLTAVVPIRTNAAIAATVLFGVAVVLLRITVGNPWRYVGVRPVRPRVVFYSLVASLAIIIPTLSLESVIARFIQVPEAVIEALIEMLRARSLPELIYVWLVAAVGAAVSEEFIFRGILQTCLAERVRGWVAVFLTALVFGLLHTIWRLPQAFVLGSFLGFLYLRTGSLIPPLIGHLVINSVSVVVIFLGETYGIEAIPAWAVEFRSPSLILVGLSLGVFFGSMMLVWRFSAAEAQPGLPAGTASVSDDGTPAGHLPPSEADRSTLRP
jgi:membrane protease YdiL (CAAX protease family)